MIYYRSGQWFVSTEKIVYSRDGEVLESVIGQEGKQWWKNFANEWKDMKIINFSDLENITPLILSRLEKANKYKIAEDYLEQVEEYVLEGSFSKESGHPLQIIEQAEANLRREELMIQKEFEDSLAAIDLYPLIEKVINDGRYGSQNEMETKLNAFALSGKLDRQEVSKLEKVLSSRVSKDLNSGSVPTGSTLEVLYTQHNEVSELKELLADLSELILPLEVE